jgi:hypothetical protein
MLVAIEQNSRLERKVGWLAKSFCDKKQRNKPQAELAQSYITSRREA